MTLSTNSTTLQIVRLIKAPRKRLYEAWTNTAQAKQWWKTEGCVTDELDIDAWRGGRFHWVVSKPDGEKLTVRGKFHTVHPQEKIVQTWQWVESPEWKDAWSLVTVEFLDKEENSQTELRLTQERLPDEQARDNHLNGWNKALDNLERMLGMQV